MKITAIKAQVKNPERVSVFVDNKYSFSLSLGQLLDEKLKKGDELQQSDLKKLKKISEDGKLKQRTLEWALNRPHSERELRDYLYKKNAEKELSESILAEFKEKQYIDDTRFAQWFAENRRRKNKSSRAISAELYAKGVASDVIKQTLQQIDSNPADSTQSEKEALQQLVDKLSGRTRYADTDKLKEHLLRKGFSYSLIKEVLEQG